jgi:hypothetical protein
MAKSAIMNNGSSMAADARAHQTGVMSAKLKIIIESGGTKA